MELIIGIILAALIVILNAEDETLEDMRDRAAVARMADRSRARKAPGLRKPCRYVRAGYMHQTARK